MKVRSVSLACVIVFLAFTSPFFAEGLTLSLSDPELGNFVLKKENPLKETGGGLGGVSIGEYTYTVNRSSSSYIGDQESGTLLCLPSSGVTLRSS
jgi:hypothetical protein